MNEKVQMMVQAVTEVYNTGDDQNTELLMGGLKSLYECGAISEEEISFAEQQVEAAKETEQDYKAEGAGTELADATVVWLRQIAPRCHELLSTSIQLSAEFLHDYWVGRYL